MRKAFRLLVFLLACAALGLVFGYVYLQQSRSELEAKGAQRLTLTPRK
jgi:uncharacterized membrane protein YpjA